MKFLLRIIVDIFVFVWKVCQLYFNLQAINMVHVHNMYNVYTYIDISKSYRVFTLVIWLFE